MSRSSLGVVACVAGLALVADGRLVEGEFTPAASGREFCDPAVLRTIRRRSVAALRADPELARLVVADGDLHPDQVPWLARAGVRQYHVADQVRPGGSHKAYVDESLVRSWRLLLDAEARPRR